MRGSHLRKPFGENAPLTLPMITVEFPHMQMQEDLHLLNRQIPNRALIAAMNTMSDRSTHRTASRTRYSFAGENQTIRLSPRRKQAEAAQMRKKNMQRQGKTPKVQEDL